MEETIVELVKQLEEIAPHVWQVVMRQVYVEVASKLCWACLWGTFAVILYKTRDRIEESFEIDERLSVFLSIVFGLLAFGLTISAIKWIANPEFYAIRWLIQQITP